MKKILNYIILGVFITAAYSCEEDATSNSANYLTFASSSQVATVDVGEGSATMDVTVYTGNKSGSDRTFSVMVDAASSADPSAYSVPLSVTVPGGTNVGTIAVTLNEVGLDFTASTIVLGFAGNQGISTGENLTINASLVCPAQNQVTFAVSTDNWPDETSWEITDGAGAVVASGGPFVNPDDDFTTINSDLCLLAGTYTATVFDSYGDGGGSFVVTSNGATLAMASAPDAGGGYPVVTMGSDTFTMN